METIPAPLEAAELTRQRPPSPPAPGGRSPFLEALVILLSWRRVIIAVTVGVLAVVLVYSIVAKPVYVAQSSLLPKQEASELMGLSSILSSQFGALAAGGVAGSTSSTDVLMMILESNYLKDRIIDRFDLIRTLKIKGKTPEHQRELARVRLGKMVKVSLTRRFSIFLEVRAADPKLAADIANAYFEELDRLNQEFEFTSARQTRTFIEQRLAETRDSLSIGQARLEQFQKQHGMIALDEQAKAELEVAAKLEGELIAMEAQLQVMRQYSTGAFSKTRELEHKIGAMRSQLSGMAGSGSDAERAPGSLFISFSRMPGLGRQLADLMLDVKTQEAVFMLLTTQYHQAKIEEARDIPTIQVLDRAVPPVGRDSPRRKQNVLIGLVVGLGGGILLAFALEYLDRALKGSSGLRMKKQVGPGLVRLENWLAGLKA
jgi:tyrosine-protein kinase Etk/Wzc